MIRVGDKVVTEIRRGVFPDFIERGSIGIVVGIAGSYLTVSFLEGRILMTKHYHLLYDENSGLDL